MEINLRKASAVSKALLELAKKQPLPRTVEVSIYDENPAQASVNLQAEKLRENLATARLLTEAAFEIRGLIGTANQTFGISAALTKKAALDAQERLLAAVVEPASDHAFNAAADPLFADAKLEAMRAKQKGDTVYGVTEELAVKVATSDVILPLKEELLNIRYEKSKLADQIQSTNHFSTIFVSQDIGDLLLKYKLV